MTPERIKEFTTLPTFDKDVWVLVKETKTNIPVSIGICIHDNRIKETELDWIYVHKDHQRKKVGRMLISEIIRRSIPKSKIIRVGGVADEFYIKCGFNIKTEPWLWIPKKDTKVGWWD